MKIFYRVQNSPKPEELALFFEEAFTDTVNFTAQQHQTLSEWFSVEEMIDYMLHGQLIEARLEHGELVGSLFIGKQNPISWTDGKKMEIFILGVAKAYRRTGVSTELINLCEKYAKDQHSKSIIVHTHITMISVHAMYEKLNYERIGVLENFYDNGDAVFFKKEL